MLQPGFSFKNQSLSCCFLELNVGCIYEDDVENSEFLCIVI